MRTEEQEEEEVSALKELRMERPARGYAAFSSEAQDSTACSHQQEMRGRETAGGQWRGRGGGSDRLSASLGGRGGSIWTERV